MNLIDSSGWIEFFADGPQAGVFDSFLKDPGNIVTPTIVIYEVFKKLKRDKGEQVAELCLGLIRKTSVVALDENLTLLAVELSLEHSLAMADSIVLATA